AASPAKLPTEPPASAALHGGAQRPAEAAGWVRSELYFGVGEESGVSAREQTDAISDAQWEAFLDKEVTPRFPDGLTVFDAYGQGSEEHTSELQSRETLVCRLLLAEKT